jgi:hypothetical protein
LQVWQLGIHYGATLVEMLYCQQIVDRQWTVIAEQDTTQTRDRKETEKRQKETLFQSLKDELNLYL